jgi:hypothetical protein
VTARRGWLVTGLVTGLVAALLIGAAVAPGAVSAQEAVADDRSAFVVDVEEDGDATVSLSLTYALDDESDEAAFDRLREDTANVTQRFDERLSRIANRTASETGREMSVSDVEAAVTTTDGVGVLTLSATWSNLAAVEGDRLVVESPFANDFRPNRPFVLVAPDGYALTDTAVPADRSEGPVTEWNAGTDLTGFSVTLAPSEAVDGATTSESLPAPLASVLAAGLVALLGYAGWRRL